MRKTGNGIVKQSEDMKTRAGIFYHDKNLTLDNEAIIEQHKNEVENSELISSSKFIKQYKKDHKT